MGSDAAILDLCRHRAVAHDGTCHKLWEHRHIEQEIAKGFLHRTLTTIDIDEIRHRLKCVETHADGQSDVRVRHGDA